MISNHTAPARLKLTQSRLASLRGELERTGLSVRTLLKTHQSETHGITYKIVYDWLTGRVKTADTDHYNGLVTLLKRLPSWDEEYVEVSKKVLTALQAEQRRTGLGPKKLMKRVDSMPKGLTVLHIENVMRGLVKTTRRSYVEWLLREWKKHPDASVRVRITSEMVHHMMNEKVRTGIGPMALLWGTNGIRPRGLTTSLLDAWLSGRTQSARKDHIDFVIERWQAMSDAATHGGG